MKKTLFYLFAAIAIVSAASCSKADLTPDNGAQDGIRAITLQFDNSDATKVALDGNMPKWEVGDQIYITNNSTDSNNSETITLAAEDINTVTNTATIKTHLSGALYAVYPASACRTINKDTDKISIRIPSKTDGTFKNAHIAVAKGEISLTFKNAVSILKINTSGVDDLYGIKISSSSALSGTYRVTYGEQLNGEAASYDYGRIDYITLFPASAGVQYVAVAPGTLSAGTEFTVVKNDHSWGTKTTSAAIDVSFNKFYDLGVVSSDWGLTFDTSGTMHGKFSVADGKQVCFSRGNLQATKTATGFSWGFASHQYQAVGYADVDGQSEGQKIDYFGWSTSATNYGISSSTTDGDYSGDFKDWGTSFGESSPWRTLTSDEWTYLIDNHGYYVNQKICGTKCIIIFPDGYIDYTNFPSAGNHTLDDAVWQEMELVGAIFLPQNGYRKGNFLSGDGYYYSSASAYDSDSIYSLYAYNSWNSTPYISNNLGRSDGLSVRLVTDINGE